MDNPLLIIAIIVVVIVAAFLLPRWMRRSTDAAGSRTRRRLEDAERERILRELGATIVIQAPMPVAREIVDEVVDRMPRKFTTLADGGYGIRFLEEDDAIARLVETPDGARLQVERSREYLGMPKGAQFWSDLRAAVAAAAESRGITVAEGAGDGFASDGGRPPLWMRSTTA